MTKTAVRARDLMQTEVVQLSIDTPVEEAVATFEEYNIRGAPVVDSTGRLVGVFSAHDLTRTEHVHGGRLSVERDEYYLANRDDDEGPDLDPEGYSPGILGRETVGDWMRPGVISVGPDASLKEICRVMVKESIHRVLVTQNDRLKGLISTFDIVRYLAREL
jgi:CBS domain-containing protein